MIESRPCADVPLSVTQTVILNEQSMNQFTSILGKSCRQACGLDIGISIATQQAHVSCNSCTDSAITETAIKFLPGLANSLILDSALVDPHQIKDLSPADASQIELVTSETIPEQSSPILVGESATVFRSSGYFKLTNGDTLYFAQPANGQKIIEPGTPLLIEQPRC